MNPYGSDFTIREMERLNRLTDELDRIDRMVNPLKYRAAELNMVENIAAKLDPMAHMAHQLDPANHMISEIDQFERSKQDLEPFPTQSVIAAQDALSQQIRSTITPLAAMLVPPDIVPPFDVAPPQNIPEDPMRWINDPRIPVDRPALDLPEFDFPKGKALTVLHEMSDEEIHAFLDDNPSPIAALKALHELMKRHLNQVTRPHWSVTWTFWLVVASFIASLISIALMLK